MKHLPVLEKLASREEVASSVPACFFSILQLRYNPILSFSSGEQPRGQTRASCLGGPLGPHKLLRGPPTTLSWKYRFWFINVQLTSLEGKWSSVCSHSKSAQTCYTEVAKATRSIASSHIVLQMGKSLSFGRVCVWRGIIFDLHDHAFLEKSVTEPKSYSCYSFPKCRSQYFLYTCRSILKAFHSKLILFHRFWQPHCYFSG